MPTIDSSTGRRGFLLAAGSLAATPLISQAQGQATAPSTLTGGRKLGQLEVSRIGLGVQRVRGARLPDAVLAYSGVEAPVRENR